MTQRDDQPTVIHVSSDARHAMKQKSWTSNRVDHSDKSSPGHQLTSTTGETSREKFPAGSHQLRIIAALNIKVLKSWITQHQVTRAKKLRLQSLNELPKVQKASHIPWLIHNPVYLRPEPLKHQWVLESPGEVAKTQIPGLHPLILWFSWSENLHFGQVLGGVDAAHHWLHFE